MRTDGRTERAALHLAHWVLGAFALGLTAVAGMATALLPGGLGPRPAAAAVGGPFHLKASSGGLIDSAGLAGRPFLLFFGFTRCPSVCPTAMADLTKLLSDLQESGVIVSAYFVSVDPERDTPEVLREYLSSFSERIIGLTGTPQQVAALARAYHAVVQRVPTAGGDYTFNHTAMVYLMDGRGQFVGCFEPSAGREAAFARILKLMAAST